MKTIAKFGLMLFLLTFINCKNDVSKKEGLTEKDIIIEVAKKIDTVIVIDTIEPIIENSSEIIKNETISPKISNPKTTEKVVDKTTNTTTKIETPIKKEIEKVIEKEIVPVTEKVIENVTETKTVTTPIIEKVKTITSSSNWKVPEKYVAMKNPINAKTDAAIGKSLYTKHCKSCHGTTGLGDGPKAGEMNGDLGDFSSKLFQAQTDGELFYKTSFGRDDMPEFTKKLPQDEDRWLIVNYMRTLVK